MTSVKTERANIERDRLAVEAAAAEYVAELFSLHLGAFSPYPPSVRTPETGGDLSVGFRAGASGRNVEEVVREQLGRGRSMLDDEISRCRISDIHAGYRAGVQWAHEHDAGPAD